MKLIRICCLMRLEQCQLATVQILQQVGADFELNATWLHLSEKIKVHVGRLEQLVKKGEHFGGKYFVVAERGQKLAFRRDLVLLDVEHKVDNHLQTFALIEMHRLVDIWGIF